MSGKDLSSSRKEIFKRRLYKFELKLIEFIESLPQDLVTRNIANQLQRSGMSILSNYVEAIYSYSKKEFTSYLQICLRSTKESSLWLALIRDTRRAEASSDKINWLLQELDEYGRIFSSSLLTIKKGKKAKS